MAGPGNYTLDKTDPVTGQARVSIHHDFAAMLFDGSVPVDPNANGGIAVSNGIDIRADKDVTLFIKTTQNFTVSVQFTDDDGANPDWFDLCDATGAVITFTVNNARRAIPVSVKGIKMRIVLKNNGAAVDTPYVGVS